MNKLQCPKANQIQSPIHKILLGLLTTKAFKFSVKFNVYAGWFIDIFAQVVLIYLIKYRYRLITTHIVYQSFPYTYPQ